MAKTQKAQKVRTVPLSELDEGLHFRDDKFVTADLTDSILTEGVKDPLKVWQKGNRYEIIDGHRRYRTLKSLESRGRIEETYEVPILEEEGIEDSEQAAELGLLLNLRRKRLNQYEVAKAMYKLVVEKKQKVADVSKKYGMSESKVRNLLSAVMDVCEEVQVAFSKGLITLKQVNDLSKMAMDKQEAKLRQFLDLLGDEKAAIAWAKVMSGKKKPRPTVAELRQALEDFQAYIDENKGDENLADHVFMMQVQVRLINHTLTGTPSAEALYEVPEEPDA